MQFLSFIGILEQDGAWGQNQVIGESKGLEGSPGGRGYCRNLKTLWLPCPSSLVGKAAEDFWRIYPTSRQISFSSTTVNEKERSYKHLNLFWLSFWHNWFLISLLTKVCINPLFDYTQDSHSSVQTDIPGFPSHFHERCKIKDLWMFNVFAGSSSLKGWCWVIKTE